MRITAKVVGLAAFSLFAASLAVTLLITSVLPHAPQQGMIAKAEAERQKAGYAAPPTPIPIVSTLPSEALHGAPRVVPLATPLPRATPDFSAIEEPQGPRSHEHPTALQVASNPHTYVGAQVHWTCYVDLIPEPSFADAQCGPAVPSFAQAPISPQQVEREPGVVAESIRRSQLSLHGAIYAARHRATIVLTGPVADLGHGDLIVINGTVRAPLRGENAYGVTRSFPTVHVDAIVEARRRERP